MTKATKNGHKVNGEWRELHNEEPNDLYHSPYIKIGKNEVGGGM